MSSLLRILNVGVNGMQAASHGISVASHNASNTATEGYTRRLAQIDPVDPRLLGGARAAGQRRVADQFVERRLLGARSYSGESAARAGTLAILDTVLGGGPGSVGEAMQAFHTALADFASLPNEPAARTILLRRAAELGSAFQRASGELDAARVDTNARIVDEVAQVNRRLHEISDLGTRIAETEALGQDANDLRDQRDQLVREVADRVPVSTLTEADGRMHLMLAGSRALVGPDGAVHELQATTEPTSGEVRVYRTTAGATEDITGMLGSGSIAGYVDARDGALADARAGLDQLAADIATAYNGAHSAGFGLDGSSGLNLFEPHASVDGAARNLVVSSDVAGAPMRLAAAQDPGALPGDNRVALQLQSLTTSPIAAGGTLSAGDQLAALVASAGSAVQSANAQREQADLVTSQVSALRDSVSGVSTDEEMVSLMRFQRAYEASLKVIKVADDMLAELLRMRG